MIETRTLPAWVRLARAWAVAGMGGAIAAWIGFERMPLVGVMFAIAMVGAYGAAFGRADAASDVVFCGLVAGSIASFAIAYVAVLYVMMLGLGGMLALPGSR